ncbi:MAG: ABC transporter permease [Pseudomonadota bacterium]
MIELKNISKIYRNGAFEVGALQDVSLSIEQGEFVAIMGASGSGKSTLLHILGFLDRPDSGNYLLYGKNTSGLADHELANLRNQLAGFVFQQFHLLRRMNALNNVFLPSIYNSEKKVDQKDAMEKLISVGLQDRAEHRPNELSGGQQQRVAVARALINDPMFLFADEPTGNLDTKSGQEIMEILKSLNEQGKTVIMVTHEAEIAKYAKRIIRMRDGKIVSDEKSGKIESSEVSHKKIKEILSTKRSSINRDELSGHFRQAINTIISNRVRSFLSMLGILVGVAAVIAMMALGAGAKASIGERLKALGSNLLMVRGGSAQHRGVSGGVGSVTRFNFKDVDDILSLSPLVKKVSGMVRGSAQIVYQNENWNTSVEGVGFDYGEMRSTIPKIGRWFTEEDIKQRAKVVIIGTTPLAKLFGNTNPIGKIIKINRINFKVIGIAPEKGAMGSHDNDDVIYVPVTTAMYRLLGKNYLDGMYVEASDPALIDIAQGAIERVIKKGHKLYQDDDTFYIRNMSEIQEMLSSTMETMSLLLGSIAAISLLVGGIGIMNIMLVSVTERTREIGLRKAIGARRIDIMAQFLIESIVMTLSGGLFGVVVGSLSALALALFAGWSIQITFFSVFLATTFSVIVGLFFGMWPAKRASMLDPVEALRYE